MELIKVLLFLFVVMPILICLALFFIGIVGSTIFEDWNFIWPTILITLVSIILSAIIDTIIHNRKYGYDLKTSRWYLLDGEKTLTEEEEKQRKKESETRLALIMAGTSIPALLIYFACMMILD